MQDSPLLNECTARQAGHCRRDSLNPLVEGENSNNRVHPIRDQDIGANNPSPVAGLPPGHYSQEKSYDCERRLHGLRAFVRWGPLDKLSTIIEAEAGRLLRDANNECRSSKSSSNYQSELPS